MKEDDQSKGKLDPADNTSSEPSVSTDPLATSPKPEIVAKEPNFSLLILAGLLLMIFFGLVFFSPSETDTKVSKHTETEAPPLAPTPATTTPEEKVTHTENTPISNTTRAERYFAKAQATKIFIEFLEDDRRGFDINQYDSCSTIQKDTYEYDHVFIYSYNQQDNFLDLSETLKETLLDRFSKNELENILEEEHLTIEQIPLIFSTEDACTYINPLFDNFFDPSIPTVPANGSAEVIEDL